MGFFSFISHRILALALTGGAFLLGFAAYGMYLQGNAESALVAGGGTILVGFSAAYFWQTVH